MRSDRKVKRWLAVGSIAVVIAVAASLLYHECASGGAMGARYETCSCTGIEWLVSDRMAVDGPRRTICLGWVASRTCFQHRDGPAVPCQPSRP